METRKSCSRDHRRTRGNDQLSCARLYGYCRVHTAIYEPQLTSELAPLFLRCLSLSSWFQASDAVSSQSMLSITCHRRLIRVSLVVASRFRFRSPSSAIRFSLAAIGSHRLLAPTYSSANTILHYVSSSIALTESLLSNIYPEYSTVSPAVQYCIIDS
jgi:hypothetical protein